MTGIGSRILTEWRGKRGEVKARQKAIKVTTGIKERCKRQSKNDVRIVILIHCFHILPRYCVIFGVIFLSKSSFITLIVHKHLIK